MYYDVSLTVTIDASSEEEARGIATEQIQKAVDNYWSHDLIRPDIHFVERVVLVDGSNY